MVLDSQHNYLLPKRWNCPQKKFINKIKYFIHTYMSLLPTALLLYPAQHPLYSLPRPWANMNMLPVHRGLSILEISRDVILDNRWLLCLLTFT